MYRGSRTAVTWDDDYSVPDEFSDWSQGWREPLAAQWQRGFLALSKFVSLDADWDGEGAAAPDVDIVNSVAALLAQLKAARLSDPPSRVLPTPDGGVLVEWQGNGYYRELEVFKSFEGEVMTVLPDREPFHGDWHWGLTELVADPLNQQESALTWTDRRVAAITHGLSAAA
jgi:hypothetical protein